MRRARELWHALSPMETAKIRIKLGAHEFEAEGPPDLVRTQLDSFMAAVKAQPTVQPALAPAQPGVSSVDVNEVPPATSPVPPVRPADEVSSEALSRVFQVRQKLVTLLALPKTDDFRSDALLMLLYGFEKLASMPAVTGVRLSEAARQSGVTLDRADRVMRGLTQYVNAGGVRRGRRYSLNNPGRKKAEELIIGLA